MTDDAKLQTTDLKIAPVSAAAVANEFLDLSAQEPTCPPIDQMKLQKLIFYAHGWHLAIKDNPLFEEDIEAWPWGPIVRDIYSQTAAFGRRPVSGRMTKLIVPPGENFLRAKFVQQFVEDSQTKEFIKAVWDIHKMYTGIQLSNATHAAGEPWTLVKEQYGSLDGKPTIPNDLIGVVFKKKIERAKSNTSA